MMLDPEQINCGCLTVKKRSTVAGDGYGAFLFDNLLKMGIVPSYLFTGYLRLAAQIDTWVFTKNNDVSL